MSAAEETCYAYIAQDLFAFTATDTLKYDLANMALPAGVLDAKTGLLRLSQPGIQRELG